MSSAQRAAARGALSALPGRHHGDPELRRASNRAEAVIVAEGHGWL